tara:strand:- start:161 stop:643 length:483 start_codon:yes stop_codon:yes gene_type:complete
MALASKKYEKFYETTGTGKDKVDATNLTIAQNAWAIEKAEGCKNYMADPVLAPLLYQLQQMQDELDVLRSEISDNKDKTTFPGFGTSSTTALAGDTTTISTSQASAITANTAKVSQGLNTANHTLQFDVVNSKGSYTLVITVTDNSSGKPTIKTASITLA